jgi:hypothetical protein
MTAVVITLGAAVWLISLLLCVGLAQAAARGDLMRRRALAVERARRSMTAQRDRHVRRVA